ncbi:MAG: Mov34/MPN/PAD-1 family protein [Pirellulaceae bacterium]|nr:Mov34/MPN/PAD-1 family protein [Pirellulaceae bacterium]
MDSDIEFGEVEQSAPRRQLRPDQNKHYAVAACGQPRDNDLPIYVDLDAMLDMERHALSDTSVELGGVLLGGQYEDHQGQPFVVVTDSLRAAHYESTKGSFKFTHDTWSEISRQRDEFPDDLLIVGWYHTHPDWGVFLSGMDMFICDNFFNKPLDVALVIDPCRDDRGMFHWTGNPRDRIRRTNGFYLTASRFRLEELQSFAARLEGKLEMAADPRLRQLPPAGASSPTVIHLAEPRGAWQPLAVLGMLSMQFLLVALLAWRMLGPSPAATEPAAAGLRQVETERKMLDRIVGQLQVAPDGLVTQLHEQQRANELLTAANLGLHAEIQVLQTDQEATLQQQRKLNDELVALRKDLDELRQTNQQQRTKITGLEKELVAASNPEGGTPTNWTLIIGGLVALLLVGGGAAVLVTLRERRAEDERHGEPAADEPRSGDSSSAESPDEDRPWSGE